MHRSQKPPTCINNALRWSLMGVVKQKLACSLQLPMYTERASKKTNKKSTQITTINCKHTGMHACMHVCTHMHTHSSSNNHHHQNKKSLGVYLHWLQLLNKAERKQGRKLARQSVKDVVAGNMTCYFPWIDQSCRFSVCLSLLCDVLILSAWDAFWAC